MSWKAAELRRYRRRRPFSRDPPLVVPLLFGAALERRRICLKVLHQVRKSRVAL